MRKRRKFSAELKARVALEALAACCAGCVVCSRLMRWGVIPESVCQECLALQS